MPVEEVFRKSVEADLRASGAVLHRDFALTRYAEGMRAAAYLTERYRDHFRRGAWIADIGTGNGGFLLPFAERGEFRCCGVDIGISNSLRDVLTRSGIELLYALGDGERLPFATGSIDVVLCVETMEHVRAPLVGREIARILRPGGLCYLTTPARLRFLFARDPHYGIKGLLLLPDAAQAALFRTLRPNEQYEVRHIFWSVAGVMRTLPGLKIREITSKNWAGPLRRIDWDWIVAVKE